MRSRASATEAKRSSAMQALGRIRSGENSQTIWSIPSTTTRARRRRPERAVLAGFRGVRGGCDRGTRLFRRLGLGDHGVDGIVRRRLARGADDVEAAQLAGLGGGV